MPNDEKETLCTRAELARILQDAGFPVTESALASQASRDRGPRYRIFQGRAMYTREDGLAWAHECLKTPDTELGRTEREDGK